MTMMMKTFCRTALLLLTATVPLLAQYPFRTYITFDSAKVYGAGNTKAIELLKTRDTARVWLDVENYVTKPKLRIRSRDDKTRDGQIYNTMAVTSVGADSTYAEVGVTNSGYEFAAGRRIGGSGYLFWRQTYPDSTVWFIGGARKMKLDGTNLTLGTQQDNMILVDHYNNIAAPPPGAVANLAEGIVLKNNTAATSATAQNSPALKFRSNSWYEVTASSQPIEWTIHNWGFNRAGTSGGVLTFAVRRQIVDANTYLTLAPVAVDEIGRVLLGYTKDQVTTGTERYSGFWGENFGNWKVILAGKTVIGWPENAITADLIVNGKVSVNNTAATITSGTGAPTASEPNGSIYLRTDGGTGTTLYVRESGAWVAK